MHSVFPLEPNTGFSANVLIDGIPTRTNNQREYLTPSLSGIISQIKGDTVGYSLQFAKSDILQDPSELKDATRTNVAAVGKIEMTFFNASFVKTGSRRRQFDDPIPLDKIIIKESNSKDKGICAIVSYLIK